ncbi:MAG: CapA family protein, partial [Actinomycetes bacterium]
MRTRVMIAAMLIIAIVPVFAKHPGIAASAAPQPRTTAKPTIELAFAGDVHFTEQLAALLKVAPAHRLQRVKALMSGADVAVVNLETAIATSGSPAAKIYHFRAPGTALTALAAAGIDVVSMANN